MPEVRSNTNWCLTQKLKGRAEVSARRRGRTILSSASGANRITHHGPFQRLLDAGTAAWVSFPTCLQNRTSINRATRPIHHTAARIQRPRPDGELTRTMAIKTRYTSSGAAIKAMPVRRTAGRPRKALNRNSRVDGTGAPPSSNVRVERTARCGPADEASVHFLRRSPSPSLYTSRSVPTHVRCSATHDKNYSSKYPSPVGK